jgi:hypothetical protein
MKGRERLIYLERKGRGCAPPGRKEHVGPLGGAADTAPVLRDSSKASSGAQNHHEG